MSKYRTISNELIEPEYLMEQFVTANFSKSWIIIVILGGNT